MPRRQGRQGPRGGEADGGSVSRGWRWEFTPAAARQIASLDEKVRRRIIGELDLLATGSRVDSRKLEGADEYRLRVGSYRVIYGADKTDKTFLILKIADRKDSYQ